MAHSDALAAPTVHRDQPPLRILGTAVTQIEPVKRAAEADLGIATEFITLDGTEAQRRGALDPESFDVYDQWFHDLDLVWPTGSLRPLDLTRLDGWEAIEALSEPGEPPADQGDQAPQDPSRRVFVQADGNLGPHKSERIAMLPTVHNADTFAIVGDVPGVDADSWGALLAPELRGKVALQADPAIGAIDFALALKARGGFDPQAVGDLSLEEIDVLANRLGKAKAGGQFAAVWRDEAEAVSAFQSGRAVLGSLWWSGAVRLRAEGVPVRMAVPKEGSRGWYGGLALSARADEHASSRAYALANWWLTGVPGAILTRNGACFSAPELVKPHLEPNEWAFWYAGAPASAPIRDPHGHTVYGPGETREGGSHAERMASIVAWDAIMTEHNYLLRRWEDALRR